MNTHRSGVFFSALGIMFMCHTIPIDGSDGASATVAGLRCEYKVNPIGIDVLQPRFSWQIEESRRGFVQSAYQIRVATSPAGLDQDPVWDSGRVRSDQSVHVVYTGPDLQSRKRYYWQVRVWDSEGSASGFSEPGYWEMGLLKPSDWSASWISPDWDEDPARSQPCPMLRTTFAVEGEVVSARLYMTSLGLYEPYLNGLRVGDQVFTPGWTSYGKRVQYQTYDVTAQIAAGENAIGVMLGDGWYRGYLGWADQRNVYGDKLALLAQLVVTFGDGRVQVVASDRHWSAAPGAIRLSDIYLGETYDARLEMPGWNTADFHDEGWTSVRVMDYPKDVLIAPAGPPVRRIEEIKPVSILTTPEGETVFDMGQNMVGWIRLRVKGDAGTVLTLRHAEVLDKAGNLYTENLRTARQEIKYILKGMGTEVYEPHFTFQGFRYVGVDGFPGRPTRESLTGIVIHSDMTPTGHFETSNPMINQLQKNIVWGQKGNFLDVPTDCPQRDERMGWTGDAQVFARTAAFNMDVAGFFTKWLGDLDADQKPNGSVPWVIPDVLTRGGDDKGGGATGWADAAVIIPWTLYLIYGDTRILENQYESMKSWIGFMQSRAGDNLIWQGDSHFGDWLAFSTANPSYPGATTDTDLIATAYFAHSTELVQAIAKILQKKEDASTYGKLSQAIKQAFQREFVTPSGRLASNTQTAYALALAFGLLPDGQRIQAGQRLAQDIRRFRNHITTGFLGTPLLCHVLSDVELTDVAYDLLLQETYPSWLYPIKMGATTIWERWDGMKPDSSFQDPGMNSFNHYAYGAVGDWMYRVVAGLETDQAEPGYKHTLIQPRPGGGLESAMARFNTMYGELLSKWAINDGVFALDIVVPANTRATVRLPNASLDRVTEGGSKLDAADGVVHSSQDGNEVVVEVGSGQYGFVYPIVNR